MAKPEFENLDVDIWVYHGQLGKSKPAICLFHSAPHVGQQILDAVDELKLEECPSKRTLTFKPSRRPHAIRSLKLVFLMETDDLRVMNIDCESAAAVIQMTAAGLPLVRDAILKWLAGCEDFGISSRHSSLGLRNLGHLDRTSAELWFWGPGYDGP